MLIHWEGGGMVDVRQQCADVVEDDVLLMRARGPMDRFCPDGMGTLELRMSVMWPAGCRRCSDRESECESDGLFSGGRWWRLLMSAEISDVCGTRFR